ncbi:hypothetical protein HanRHA438_Chr04g0160291 [Helianthus annuus]|nr:hypothetical protein HanHA89_Chr04g0136271 [Helianthus annuus]KAJ0925486.1 hypothetical protein HanRHA438_Chr04g0160291 [Helianthus annuus]
MSRTGRSSIRSVLTAKDLKAFVDAYKIPGRFSSILSRPDESAKCIPDRIVIYTLSFSSCGVPYPLSAFKVDLLRHFGVHFSQLHPLGFMRVVHFELSCVAVSGEPLVPLFCMFCMFYKLISNGDWFTFAKRKDSVSPPCYSFMPTSTYPKEWKSRFIFVSVAMIPEVPPLRDLKAAIEDSVPVLSADEIVQWKRMHENPTRAFTFPEGVLAMGGLSPFYSVRPKAFFRKKGIPLPLDLLQMTLWGLLQGGCRDVKFMVGDKVKPSMSRGVEKKVPESSVQAGDFAVEGKDEESSSDGKEDSQGSLRMKSSSNDEDDEDLETRLIRKRKAAQASSPKGSSKALIEIPTAPSSSRVRDKTLEISVARITPAFDVSPLHATGTICHFLRVFRGVGMLQQMDELRRENEGLKADLKTSQTVAAELRCRVTDAERKLLKEKGAGVMLEQREHVWERERMAWVEEKEELVAELKRQKELDSVSQGDLDTMYVEWGIVVDDNQKLAKERYWLIPEGFGSFLTVVSQSEEFKGSLERIYRAYRDVGYQSGLKDGYAYSA